MKKTFGELILGDTVYLKSHGQIKEQTVTGVMLINPYDKQSIDIWTDAVTLNFEIEKYHHIDNVPRHSSLYEYYNGFVISTNLKDIQSEESSIEFLATKKTFGELKLGDALYIYNAGHNKVYRFNVTSIAIKNGVINLNCNSYYIINNLSDDECYSIIKTISDEVFYYATSLDILRDVVIDNIFSEVNYDILEEKTFGDLRLGDNIYLYKGSELQITNSKIFSLSLANDVNLIKITLDNGNSITVNRSSSYYDLISDNGIIYILTFNPDNIRKVVLQAFEYINV